MGDLLMEYLKVFHFANSTILLLQTVLSAIVVIITAEFLPKVFFQIYANSLIKLFAVPAYLFYLIL